MVGISETLTFLAAVMTGNHNFLIVRENHESSNEMCSAGSMGNLVIVLLETGSTTLFQKIKLQTVPFFVGVWVGTNTYIQ